MLIKILYLEKCPLTNGQFKKFLDAFGYQFANGHNFVDQWESGPYLDVWR